jgi:hypothetical protein
MRPWVSWCPMTRVHVRLLGPCFKTGRVGRPVLSAADRKVSSISPRNPRADNAHPIAADRSPRATSGLTLARGTGAHKSARESSMNDDRRKRTGTPGIRGSSEEQPRARPQAVGPLFQNPTGRGVLLGEKCAPSPARNYPSDRRPRRFDPRRPFHRTVGAAARNGY